MVGGAPPCGSHQNSNDFKSPSPPILSFPFQFHPNPEAPASTSTSTAPPRSSNPRSARHVRARGAPGGAAPQGEQPGGRAAREAAAHRRRDREGAARRRADAAAATAGGADGVRGQGGRRSPPQREDEGEEQDGLQGLSLLPSLDVVMLPLVRYRRACSCVPTSSENTSGCLDSSSTDCIDAVLFFF